MTLGASVRTQEDRIKCPLKREETVLHDGSEVGLKSVVEGLKFQMTVVLEVL